MRRLFLLCVAAVLPSAFGFATTPYTEKEALAREVTLRSLAGINENYNNLATIEQFSDPTDPNAYAFVYLNTGRNVAHGANSANVGKTLTQIIEGAGLSDKVDGQKLNMQFVDAAAKPDGGFVTYTWYNSVGSFEKRAYIHHIDLANGSGYIGSGYTVA